MADTKENRSRVEILLLLSSMGGRQGNNGAECTEYDDGISRAGLDSVGEERSMEGLGSQHKLKRRVEVEA
jgi:hypothetical protein